MRRGVIYEGLFFDRDNTEILRKLERGRLAKSIGRPHCTFCFRPSAEDIPEEIAGYEFTVKIVGVGANQNNSGLLVELPDSLKKYYKNVDIEGKTVPPHITMSTSIYGKPVNTRFLKFEPIEPVEVRGKFGFFMGGVDGRGRIGF